jgi:hypothetical protein
MTATEAVTSIDEFLERLWPWPTLRQRQRTLHGKYLSFNTVGKPHRRAFKEAACL